jgi:hypothetical protein
MTSKTLNMTGAGVCTPAYLAVDRDFPLGVFVKKADPEETGQYTVQFSAEIPPVSWFEHEDWSDLIASKSGRVTLPTAAVRLTGNRAAVLGICKPNLR